MLNILVVDDERPARDELKYLITSILISAQVYEAGGGQQALQLIKDKELDAVFIDINMNDIDGISLAREIYEINKNVKIVFATAYDLYAVKAFELNAADYILKPFEEERVRKTLNRLLKEKNAQDDSSTQRMKAFVNNVEKRVRKISVWRGDRVVLLDIKDIVYISTDERSCLIKTVDGEFSSNQTLGYFEKRLELENFFRVHRSFLINLEFVREIQPWFNNTYIVKMQNYEKDEIPVSRKQIKNLRDVFEF